ERWQNWREERAELRAGLNGAAAGPVAIYGRGAGLPFEETSPTPERRAAGFFGRLFRRRAPEPDPLDDIPAYQRRDFEPEEVIEQGEEIPVVPPARRASIWEREGDGEPAPHKIASIRPDMANGAAHTRADETRYTESRFVD